jgi:SAM-dependent methyltransferase
MNTFRQYDYYQYHYKKWEPSPEEGATHRRGLWRMFGQYVPPDRGTNILDIGCGTGQWLMTLAEREYKNIEGVELSPQQSHVCLERKLPVKLVNDTSEFLASCEPTYGLITMFDVLEHIPKEDQIRVISGARAALKVGGTFICTVPNANSIVAARWRYIDWTHEISFTEDSLDYVLSVAGFCNIRVHESRGKPRMPWLLRPSVLNYYWRNYQRWKYRCLLYAEIGKQAWGIPLSYNLIGIGMR